MSDNNANNNNAEQGSFLSQSVTTLLTVGNSAVSSVSSVSSSAVSSVSSAWNGLWAPAAPIPPPAIPKQPKPLPDAEGLRKSLSDAKVLLLPEEAAYLEARFDNTWNYDTMGVPSAIALPKTEADVVQLVKYAGVKGVKLGVTCGHHSHFCCLDDTLVVDLRFFDAIEVDANAKIAKVGGGARLGAVDNACKPHGLAATFGHDPTTGVGGLTLNGGLGFLARVYGMTVDHLLGARVVLASGLVVNTSEKEHPDLFWALRGGSGNFGIVLSFTFQLNTLPENGMLLGGTRVHMPFWPLPDRAALIDYFFNVTRDAPDEFADTLILTPVPVVEIPMWIGQRADGVRFFQEKVWSVGWPVQDLSKSTSATGQDYWSVHQTTVAGPGGKTTAPRHYYLKSLLLGAEVGADFREALVQCHKEMPNSECAIIMIVLGGKASRVPINATAVALRDAAYWVMINGSWGTGAGPVVDIEMRARVVEWTKRCHTRLSKCKGPIGTYGALPAMDTLYVDITDDGKSMYGENLARLRTVKKKYDPSNVFRVNHNIPPAK